MPSAITGYVFHNTDSVCLITLIFCVSKHSFCVLDFVLHINPNLGIEIKTHLNQAISELNEANDLDDT